MSEGSGVTGQSTPHESSQPLNIICFLFDPHVGGPSIRARMVYERMSDSGHLARIACPRNQGSVEGYMAEKDIPFDHLDIDKPVLPSKIKAFAGFVLRFPRSILRMRAYLRRHLPDVIHVNGAFDMGPVLAGRLSGVPVVWHLNDTVFSQRFSRILGFFVRRLATIVVAAAGRVAKHYGVEDVAHIIFAPVDVDRFLPRPPAGFPRSEPVIGLLGNWNWIKGQDRFVEAIARLRDQELPVKGQIMGRFLDSQEAFWKPVIERMKADKLDQVIACPGFVEDTVEALGGLDILLLTSHSEASPICVLEAMSIGVPVVSFDVGGVREMLGDGEESAGLVVPEGDVAALVKAAASLLRDPARYSRMALAGQARAREYFSMEACVKRHEAAYRAAIATRKTTS